MGNLGWLVCAYCSLKHDVPFVSGSCMIGVNDYHRKIRLIFLFIYFFYLFIYLFIYLFFFFFFLKKLRKMGPTTSTWK